MRQGNAIDLQEVGRRLRARGMRLSRLKRAVLTELAGTELPLAAEELASQIDGEDDPSPVYRCLASLEVAGIVSHLYLGDACRRWALSEEFGGHHDYLVCAECAAIEPLADCALAEAVRERIGKGGFTLLDHQVILTGICSHCQVDGPAGTPKVGV